MTKEVLKRPILTEKATLQAEKGIYHFAVAQGTNKIEIAATTIHFITLTLIRAPSSQKQSCRATAPVADQIR